MCRVHLWLLVLFFVYLSGAPIAQRPASSSETGAWSLSGRVTDGRTGEPLPWSTLSLDSAGLTSDEVATEEGRFAIQVTGNGPVVIHVSKPGYATATLRFSAQPHTLNVALVPGASVNGRIIDSTGTPMIDLPVALRGVTSADAAAAFVDQARLAITDDRGRYRFGDLPPGRYAIGVIRFPTPYARSTAAVTELLGRIGREPTALPAFTPSATVTLGVGDESDAGDLLVAAETPCQSVPRQSQPTDIAGVAMDPLGRRLPCVSISVHGKWERTSTVVSDSSGEFGLDNPGSDFDLLAEKPGYVHTRTVRRRSAGDRGQARTVSEPEITVVLTKLGVVNGRVVNEHGDAVANARISAVQIRALDGRQIAATVGHAQFVYSNDKGEYRLHGLQAGEYLIQSDPSGASRRSVTRQDSYVTAYYPDAVTPRSAATVSVTLDTELSGIDISHKRIKTWRVAGTAYDQGGAPLAGIVTLSVSAASGETVVTPKRSQIHMDGTFMFEGVASGDYVVQAMGGRRFGFQHVVVTNESPGPITIVARPGATLKGHMVVEPGVDQSMPAQVVSLPVMSDESPIGSLSPIRPVAVVGGGEFQLRDLIGLQRIVLIAGGNGYLKTLRVGGRDVVDEPFDPWQAGNTGSHAELVIGRGGTISGHVVDTHERPRPSVSVVAFSTDPARWFRYSRFVRATRTSDTGSFLIQGMPPGEYWLNVTDTPLAGSDVTIPLLESLTTSALRLELREGDSRSAMRLRLARDP